MCAREREKGGEQRRHVVREMDFLRQLCVVQCVWYMLLLLSLSMLMRLYWLLLYKLLLPLHFLSLCLLLLLLLSSSSLQIWFGGGGKAWPGLQRICKKDCVCRVGLLLLLLSAIHVARALATEVFDGERGYFWRRRRRGDDDLIMPLCTWINQRRAGTIFHQGGGGSLQL